MNKVLVIILLTLLFSTTSFAESYYFKECKMDEQYSANYIIDFDKNVINVKFIQKRWPLSRMDRHN